MSNHKDFTLSGPWCSIALRKLSIDHWIVMFYSKRMSAGRGNWLVFSLWTNNQTINCSDSTPQCISWGIITLLQNALSFSLSYIKNNMLHISSRNCLSFLLQFNLTLRSSGDQPHSMILHCNNIYPHFMLWYSHDINIGTGICTPSPRTHASVLLFHFSLNPGGRDCF